MNYESNKSLKYSAINCWLGNRNSDHAKEDKFRGNEPRYFPLLDLVLLAKSFKINFLLRPTKLKALRQATPEKFLSNAEIKAVTGHSLWKNENMFYWSLIRYTTHSTSERTWEEWRKANRVQTTTKIDNDTHTRGGEREKHSKHSIEVELWDVCAPTLSFFPKSILTYAKKCVATTSTYRRRVQSNVWQENVDTFAIAFWYSHWFLFSFLTFDHDALITSSHGDNHMILLLLHYVDDSNLRHANDLINGWFHSRWRVSIFGGFFFSFFAFCWAWQNAKCQMATTLDSRIQQVWRLSRVVLREVTEISGQRKVRRFLEFSCLFTLNYEIWSRILMMYACELNEPTACRRQMQTFFKAKTISDLLFKFYDPKEARALHILFLQLSWRRFIDVRRRTIEGRIIDCPKKAKAFAIYIWWSHGRFCLGFKICIFFLTSSRQPKSFTWFIHDYRLPSTPPTWVAVVERKLPTSHSTHISSRTATTKKGLRLN